MAYPGVGASTITTGVTTVDCQKQVRSWRLLRSLIEILIPTCNCNFIEDDHDQLPTKQKSHVSRYYYPHLPGQPSFSCSNNIITGTIFGYRRGKVNFCIQTTSKSNPILLLELALPTTVLAKEMQGGFLRIGLESTSPGPGHNSTSTNSLLETPIWTMYCNSRKVGYAIKRRGSKHDLEALRLMDSVAIGAGIVNGKKEDCDDEIMYLRANFERVCGSANSESFHLIDPDESIGQELSIFLYRST